MANSLNYCSLCDGILVARTRQHEGKPIVSVACLQCGEAHRAPEGHELAAYAVSKDAEGNDLPLGVLFGRRGELREGVGGAVSRMF